MKEEWELYNHGWIPKCAPHETPNLAAFNSQELFLGGGYLSVIRPIMITVKRKIGGT